MSRVSSLGRVHEVKLRDLLSLRGPDALLREITTCFPPVGIGSITLVDQMVLLCLDELVRPKRILEIGTFQGFTTALLARNSAADAIFSIDLPPAMSPILGNPDEQRLFAEGSYNDDYLRNIQNSTGEVYLAGLESCVGSRVTLVKADSTLLNYSKTFGHIDYAFIDGGHDHNIVEADTRNVLSVMDEGIVIWHDYSSTIHSDVTSFLRSHAERYPVFHVVGSLCAFQLVQRQHQLA